MKKYIGYFFAGAAIYFGFAGLGYAETTVSAEVQYIFNTILFLMSGFLVMWMAAGFTMLESGLVTSKSVSAICAKNIGLYSIAGVMFWLVGYNLAYGIPEGGYIGSFTPWSDNSSLETGYSDVSVRAWNHLSRSDGVNGRGTFKDRAYCDSSATSWSPSCRGHELSLIHI